MDYNQQQGNVLKLNSASLPLSMVWMVWYWMEVLSRLAEHVEDLLNPTGMSPSEEMESGDLSILAFCSQIRENMEWEIDRQIGLQSCEHSTSLLWWKERWAETQMINVSTLYELGELFWVHPTRRRPRGRNLGSDKYDIDACYKKMCWPYQS